MRKLYLVAAIVATLTLPACSSTDDTGPGGSNTPAGNAAGLPAKLPTFDANMKQIEGAVGTTIKMAAIYAKVVPDADRHPKLEATGGFICGVKVGIQTCPPVDPDSEITTIQYSPETLSDSLKQPAERGGGQTVVQDRVLAAYMNFLIYRELRRQDPNLLFTTDEASRAKITFVMECREGNVVGGLREHGALSPELDALYRAGLDKKPNFVRGTKGEC